MTYRLKLVPLALLVLAGCDPADAPDHAAEAQRIARDSIIVDTHIDVPYRVEAEYADVSVATEGGDFDYPRAVAGGLDAAFMSIYTPAELEAEGRSKEVADGLIDYVEELAAGAPGKFAIATTTADVRRHFDEGLISLPMGLENGSPLQGELANLHHFHERGIRYITLAHSLSNHLSDSSYDENGQWGGLSEFGAAVVREMNRLGIMVDVSHLSDDAFRDVLEITRVPIIASHSSARHFTPGWERNMSDDMIRALADNGGVLMISFGSAFLTAEANAYSTARWDAEDAYKEEHPDLPEEEAEERFLEAYEAEHGPIPFASLDDALDHFDHVVGLVGAEHVGIGSDFDGVGDSLPVGLKDVSAYPNLIEGLLRRGYGEADIRKILGENLLRVWRANEDFAAASGGGDDVDQDVAQ